MRVTLQLLSAFNILIFNFNLYQINTFFIHIKLFERFDLF